MPAPRQDACVRGHQLAETATQRSDGLGRQCSVCKHTWAALQQRVVRASMVLLRHRQHCLDCRRGACRAGFELDARLTDRAAEFAAFQLAGRGATLRGW